MNCHPNYINYLLEKENISFSVRCHILDEIAKYCDEHNDYHYNKKIIQEYFK